LHLTAPPEAAEATEASVKTNDSVPVAVGVLTSEPIIADLNKPRACYVCKKRFRALHAFYADLCPDCADLNFKKRNQSVDLKGRVAIVTGGRVKIGFCVALKLLRWGCHVIVTSRFPKDCAERFGEQDDFLLWKDHLDVYGIDFRDIQSIEAFCGHVMDHYDRLDILINNACQTIRRPATYYAPYMRKESTPLESLDAKIRETLQQNDSFASRPGAVAQSAGKAITDTAEACAVTSIKADVVHDKDTIVSNSEGTHRLTSAEQSQMHLIAEDSLAGEEVLPVGLVDVNAQQLDLRDRNTWIMKLEEIETPEVAEVMAINAIAPFVLNSRLAPLMRRTGVEGDRKFIVNVSAMEGKFYRSKSVYHPHTNMAKAALNMMTRTSAEDLVKGHIYMTAVDTGWINDENPLEKAKRYADKHNFQTPLDEVDAAARILDPVVHGLDIAAVPYSGIFLKDYLPTEW